MSTDRCRHGVEMSSICDQCDDERAEQGECSFAAPSGSPDGIESEVCADIAARQRKGVAKYGTTVADNPLPLNAWLQHAYEECLDQAVYLKRVMREMENSGIQPNPKGKD